MDALLQNGFELMAVGMGTVFVFLGLLVVVTLKFGREPLFFQIYLFTTLFCSPTATQNSMEYIFSRGYAKIPNSYLSTVGGTGLTKAVL